ncbi:MAG: acyltransferase [Sphingobacteriales bacterium]|nr:acyltransferase [Sphingobacteriales bacterium]
MSLSSYIKSNPRLKKFVHWMIVPTHDFRPRLWIRLFVNPFRNKKGKNAIIRRNAKLDVLPFNSFSVGANSIIEDFATINNGVGDISIGEHSMIGRGNVVIGPVNIGNRVMLAPNIVISGLNHGYEDVNVSPSNQPVTTQTINIKDDVWIGANSVITAGVTIGKHAVVGAGSVVTKDVPDFCIAAGNPAKIIKKYNKESNSWEKVI